MIPVVVPRSLQGLTFLVDFFCGLGSLVGWVRGQRKCKFNHKVWVNPDRSHLRPSDWIRKLYRFLRGANTDLLENTSSSSLKVQTTQGLTLWRARCDVRSTTTLYSFAQHYCFVVSKKYGHIVVSPRPSLLHNKLTPIILSFFFAGVGYGTSYFRGQGFQMSEYTVFFFFNFSLRVLHKVRLAFDNPPRMHGNPVFRILSKDVVVPGDSPLAWDILWLFTPLSVTQIFIFSQPTNPSKWLAFKVPLLLLTLGFCKDHFIVWLGMRPR
jgi:hypothetical protein